MSTRILLQTILKLQDQIKTGAANFMDVSAEYFKSTGNFLDDSQKAVALEEINKIAPDNVTTLEGVDAVETILPTRGPNVQKAGEMSDTPFTDKVKKDQGIESLRGDETFGELTEKMGPADDTPSFIKDFDKNLDQLSFSRFGRAYKDLEVDEKDTILASMKKVGDEVFGTSTVPDPIKDFDKNLDQLALSRFGRTYKELDVDEKDTILAQMKKIGDEVFGTKKEGIGSLFPKDQSGFGLDDRGEAATFIKAMRDAGIKNEDIRKVFKDNPPYRKSSAFYGQDKNKMILDLEPGKRAATSLARAADMGADTTIKQELLANLDDDIANYGPDWWKGMGYNEGPMGRESVGNLLESMTTDINNGVIDDLIKQGMDEDEAFKLMRYVGREELKFDPKAFIRKITDELETNDVKYDMTFWDNYVDEILTRIRKPAPRFADGGLV